MHKHGQLGMGMRIRNRLRPSSRRRCRLLLGGDTAAFCASLVEGLAHLESTLEVDHQSSGTVSMRWCADAMRLVKRMQQEMLAIFRKADVPVAAGAGAGAARADWFEHYMQETAALLDFCNAFKAAVSRMHRYCMVVEFAAQVIVGCAADSCDGGAAAASLVVESAGAAPATAEPCQAAFRDKMADAKAALAEAQRLGRAIIISGASGGDASGMVVVTLVAKITTSVLSMFVLQALTAPPATIIDIHNGSVRHTIASAVDVEVVPPELEPWCESLSLIHARFPRHVTMAEHEKVATAVRDLINGKVDGGGGHGEQQEELLRARSSELREGVEMFDCVLDEVFDEVIKGRNEMLGILRDKALTLQ